jgi:hypothetical protein
MDPLWPQRSSPEKSRIEYRRPNSLAHGHINSTQKKNPI